MKIGYARVSTKQQSPDLQIDALRADGCERVYVDVVSGAKADRPELGKLQEMLRPNDVVVVWKLDRLGRSLRNLVELFEIFAAKGVGLRSLNDHLDTTTPQGKLVFHLFAALAEFERDIIRERTVAGLEAARSRGRKGGRPEGLSKEAKNKAIAAAALYQQKAMSVQEICRQLSISKTSFYKYLRHQGVKIESNKP
jgi:DNA invertase Pin-like site-specific DNA recombinase